MFVFLVEQGEVIDALRASAHPVALSKPGSKGALELILTQDEFLDRIVL